MAKMTAITTMIPSTSIPSCLTAPPPPPKSKPFGKLGNPEPVAKAVCAKMAIITTPNSPPRRWPGSGPTGSAWRNKTWSPPGITARGFQQSGCNANQFTPGIDQQLGIDASEMAFNRAIADVQEGPDVAGRVPLCGETRDLKFPPSQRPYAVR